VPGLLEDPWMPVFPVKLEKRLIPPLSGRSVRFWPAKELHLSKLTRYSWPR
jgi:hypothetical protein